MHVGVWICGCCDPLGCSSAHFSNLICSNFKRKKGFGPVVDGTMTGSRRKGMDVGPTTHLWVGGGEEFTYLLLTV